MATIARRQGNPDGTPAWGGSTPPYLDGVGQWGEDNTIALDDWMSGWRKHADGSIVAQLAGGQERVIYWGDPLKPLSIRERKMALERWALKSGVAIERTGKKKEE